MAAAWRICPHDALACMGLSSLLPDFSKLLAIWPHCVRSSGLLPYFSKPLAMAALREVSGKYMMPKTCRCHARAFFELLAWSH